jgi:hypothetical protein
MSANLKFIVEDPDRKVHIIERDLKGEWFGAENIAMHFSEQSARHIARQGVLRAMENTLDTHGSWGHYTWVRQD